MRALQGFSGGVLIPLSLMCVITLLPPRARPVGFALFSLSATFAPAIGPTIGGLITDVYGWRYIFFLNLVPGAVMLVALFWGLDRAPMQLEQILSRAIGSALSPWRWAWATLQMVLEEGNKDDWFGSPFILHFSRSSRRSR